MGPGSISPAAGSEPASVGSSAGALASSVDVVSPASVGSTGMVSAGRVSAGGAGSTVSPGVVLLPQAVSERAAAARTASVFIGLSDIVSPSGWALPGCSGKG